MTDPLLPPMPRLSRGGIIRSPAADRDAVPIDFDWGHQIRRPTTSADEQVMVPVGMSDLLDDWLWSPDAARWDPEVVARSDGHMAIDTFGGEVFVRVRPDAWAWCESMAQMTAAIEPFAAVVRQSGRSVQQLIEQLAVNQRSANVAGSEVDEGPPADVRGRALWLRQHRNTGPARPPGTWYG